MTLTEFNSLEFIYYSRQPCSGTPLGKKLEVYSQEQSLFTSLILIGLALLENVYRNVD